MNRVELKTLAKQQIKGNVWKVFLCNLVITLVIYAAALITFFIGGLGALILSAPFQLATTMIFLKLAKGVSPVVADVFKGFKNFGRAFVLMLLVSIFTLLWSLLFVIPGYVKMLSYSMSFYILADNPDISAREALNRSKYMMNGHKMELFVLVLSFIPWLLLITITCGIAAIYVVPYMNMTMTNFYHRVRNYSLDK